MRNALVVFVLARGILTAGTTLPHYYGHPAVADANGVIAPWYKGQNGQFDYRVRIAAETLKRYPWSGRDKAAPPAPEYIYNGTWNIDYEGRINAVEERDWANGDLGQRAAYILSSLMEYYRYSGDPAVFTPIYATADYLIDFCQTRPDHGWPGILISVPTYGVRYGRCRLGPSDELRDSQGKIQLDIVAEAGLELVRAYEMTGNARWYEAAKRWADLLAGNRNREPGSAPWGRYANNASGRGMNGTQTGGIAFILSFFDELIRTGYTGANNSIVEARDAGRAYLRDTLLPRWYLNDTWGRNYWDWENAVQGENVTEYVLLYMMDHKDYFPNWRNDVRNILSLFLNHTSVSPLSGGDTYHGAWAYPEASNCCGRSLWYGPMEMAGVFGRYAVEADSEWAHEISRRSQLLATYDPRPDGWSMDLIDGGVMVNRTWFKIAHPMALKHVLRNISWMPDLMGPNRENHLMRSSGVVKRVVYGKDRISYSAFDAPAPAVDVLRLAYSPKSIMANAKPIAPRSDLERNGYTVRELKGGDYIVKIRRDGATEITITGADPQVMVDDAQLRFEGQWAKSAGSADYQGGTRVSSHAGAAMEYRFEGNQVRVVGRVGQSGGLADVYVDDMKQLVPVDCYSPAGVNQQILYWRNGLDNGPHRLRIVVRGQGSALSKGAEVYIDGAQSSAATGDSGFGEGGGPTDPQRLIFGYTGRKDYVDSAGNAWRPATEFVARTGHLTDVVAKTWWTMRHAVFVGGRTGSDQELYRYGVHHPDLRVNVTVGPGRYYVRLKFAETQFEGPRQRAMSVWINGRRVVEGLDVFATAGGMNAPADLVYNGIEPRNGIIEVRLAGDELRGRQCEAMIQALEVGPGDGGTGASPKTVPAN
jgi:hypothetical protein